MGVFFLSEKYDSHLENLENQGQILSLAKTKQWHTWEQFTHVHGTLKPYLACKGSKFKKNITRKVQLLKWKNKTHTTFLACCLIQKSTQKILEILQEICRILLSKPPDFLQDSPSHGFPFKSPLPFPSFSSSAFLVSVFSLLVRLFLA